MPPLPGGGHDHDGSLWQDDSSGSFLLKSQSLLSSSAKSSSVSTTGVKKILVILARFPSGTVDGTTYGELDFQTGYNAAFFQSFLGDYTDESPASLTMAEYYKQMSGGSLKLQFQVLGPYEANKCYAYYGKNSGDDDAHPKELVQEMLEQASGEVSASIDNCAVIIIHAGPGEEIGGGYDEYLWSRKASLSPAVVINKEGGGTVSYSTYVICPEYNITGTKAAPTIGVFCHEFGHVLGLMESYDTNYSTAGVGQWSLMAGGSWGSIGKNTSGKVAGADPAPLMAWERAWLGWVTEENITPSSGESKQYYFNNMDESSTVYRIDLCDNQYITLEGKKKDSSGTGMYVMETGLLITQLHQDILDKYWGYNLINAGSSRVHGAMVVEAVAANYKTNGLGNLWRGASTAYRFTTTALFRPGNLTSVGPASVSSSANVPFIVLFFDTFIVSGIVIALLVAGYYGRRKLCAAIACAALAFCLSMSCVIESGGSGGTYDAGPNTNYYTSNYVHSKTGNSGITIYNIKVNEDGSGSFWVKKD